MYFGYFLIISLWKMVGLYLNKLEFHQPRMLCAKFGSSELKIIPQYKSIDCIFVKTYHRFWLCPNMPQIAFISKHATDCVYVKQTTNSIYVKIYARLPYVKTFHRLWLRQNMQQIVFTPKHTKNLFMSKYMADCFMSKHATDCVYVQTYHKLCFCQNIPQITLSCRNNVIQIIFSTTSCLACNSKIKLDQYSYIHDLTFGVSERYFFFILFCVLTFKMVEIETCPRSNFGSAHMNLW